MKFINKILAILLIVIITKAVIVYTSSGLSRYYALGLILNTYDIFFITMLGIFELVFSATISYMIVSLIPAFVSLIISIYILKKMFKKNSYILYNLVFLTFTGGLFWMRDETILSQLRFRLVFLDFIGGLGWIVVIIMYILIKNGNIDPESFVISGGSDTYSSGGGSTYNNTDNRPDSQKYYIEYLMNPEKFDWMGRKKW